MHAKNEIDVKNGHTQGGAVWWTDASKHPNKSRFLPSVSHLEGWHLQDKCIYNRCIYPATTSPHEWIQDANIISWSNINNSRGTVASGGLVCQIQRDDRVSWIHSSLEESFLHPPEKEAQECIWYQWRKGHRRCRGVEGLHQEKGCSVKTIETRDHLLKNISRM